MKKIILFASLAFSINAFAQVPSYVPNNGLVGYWPFTGNANDESGNSHNGTVNGATLTTDRFGNTSSAYNFTGTTNDITLANSQTLVNGSFTVSAWCTIDVLSPSNYDAVLIGQFNGQISNDRKWLFGYRSISSQRGISYYFCDNSGSFLSNAYTLNWLPQVSTWYHITWIFTSANSIETYVNGILHSTVSLTLRNFNNAASTILTKIGNGIDIGSFAQLPWNGKIDDVGIWNRVLTQQEIQNLYNANICYQNVTVTDTLVINTGITGFNPITYKNTIKVYPNPTNDHITIDNGNISNLTGYQIKITNSLSQQVFQSGITQQQFYVDLSTWTGNGIYFVHIIDAQGNTIDIKKIVLQ
ncbi:MAG: T9SS type A sorting domain-containing protein [Bacteroidia bacterium]|nr:T9SS type A sorting domain-containing protein [Bacteroidia bacterium]